MPILLLEPIHISELKDAINNNLTLVIHELSYAKELVKKGVKFTCYSLKNDGLKEERDLQTVSNVSKVNNIFLEKEIKKNIAKLRTNKVKPCYKKKIKVEIERTKERHKKKIIQTNLRKKENNN